MTSAWVISCAMATMAIISEPSPYDPDRPHDVLPPKESFLETGSKFEHHYAGRKHNKYIADWQPDTKLQEKAEKLRKAGKEDQEKEEEFEDAENAIEKKITQTDLRDFKHSGTAEVKFEKKLDDDEHAFEIALRKTEKKERLKGDSFVKKFEGELDKPLKLNLDGAYDRERDRDSPSSLIQTGEAEKQDASSAVSSDALAKSRAAALKAGAEATAQMHATAKSMEAIKAQDKAQAAARAKMLAESAAELKVMNEARGKVGAAAEAKLHSEVRQLSQDANERRDEMRKLTDQRIHKFKEMEQNLKRQEQHMQEMDIKSQENDNAMMAKYEARDQQLREKSKAHLAAFEEKLSKDHKKWDARRQEDRVQFKALEKREMDEMHDALEPGAEPELRTDDSA